MVAFCALSVTIAQPSQVLKVRRSRAVTFPYRVVATSLFIRMSFLSNQTPQTPFFRFTYQISWFSRMSKSFTSPLSQPPATTLSSRLCEFPNATDQQSATTSSDTAGSSESPGAFCLGSQTLRHPSLPADAIQLTPKPQPQPQPSIELITPVWAYTSQKTLSLFISMIFNFPSSCPKEKQGVEGLEAKDPHLTPRLSVILSNCLNQDLLSCMISMIPVALGSSPQTRKRAVQGIQSQAQGVKLQDLERCSMICGALVVSMQQQQ